MPVRRARHGDGPAARPRVRKRARGRGGDRGAQGRRAAGPDGGHVRAWRRDAGARRRRAGSRCRAARAGEGDRHRARRASAFRESSRRRAGIPAVVDDPAVLPQAVGVRDLSARRAAASSRASSRKADRSRHHRTGRRPNARRGRRRPVGRLRHHRAARAIGSRRASRWRRSSRATAPGIERRASARSAIVIADEADPPLPLISHRVTTLGVSEPLPRQSDARVAYVAGVAGEVSDHFRCHEDVMPPKLRGSPGWARSARAPASSRCSRSSPTSAVTRRPAE